MISECSLCLSAIPCCCCQPSSCRFCCHSSRPLFILAAFFISSLIFLFVVSTWFFWLSVYNHSLIFNRARVAKKYEWVQLSSMFLKYIWFKYIQSTVEVEVWYDVDTFCDCSVLSSGEGGGGGQRGSFPPKLPSFSPSPKPSSFLVLSLCTT